MNTIVLDTTAGTHVLGSRFGRLLTTYRDREGDDYPHSAMGKLQFDNDWLVANIRGDVQDYYAWYVQKLFGVKLHVRSLRGAHVSVIRGEKPKANADKWGQENGDLVKIKYSHNIYTNGEHWWLNVECEDLAKIRGHYGLGTNKKWFHLTIGRL